MIRQLRRRRRHGRADGGVGRCEGLVGRTSREVRPESRGQRGCEAIRLPGWIQLQPAREESLCQVGPKGQQGWGRTTQIDQQYLSELHACIFLFLLSLCQKIRNPQSFSFSIKKHKSPKYKTKQFRLLRTDTIMRDAFAHHKTTRCFVPLKASMYSFCP
jgi:hypothetical protein